jgi:hypothetical protein
VHVVFMNPEITGRSSSGKRQTGSQRTPLEKQQRHQKLTDLGSIEERRDCAVILRQPTSLIPQAR